MYYRPCFRHLAEDYAASTTLPSNIAPISAPSKAIQRLLSKREKGHNTVVNSIKLKCQKYNVEVEEGIQRESDRLKENLERIKTEIENESRIIFNQQEEQLVNLNPNLFQTVPKAVQDLSDEAMDAIDAFYESVKNLEMQRSQYFKSVLNAGYRKTSKISHLLPYDLLNYFENEIVHLNQITMNNYRYYSQVHTDLKLQVEEKLRVFLVELSHLKEEHKMAVKMAKVREVMDLYKREDYPDKKLPVLKLQGLQDFQTMPQDTNEMEMWSKQMKMTLDHLDANAKKLVTLYKMAVVHIFNRFFDELKTITKTLNENDESQTSLDMEYMNSEAYKSIVDDITQMYTCDVADLQTLWNSITAYMESNINYTYMFLNGSSHLWDAHFERMEDLKGLLLQDLRFLINKHDRAAQNFDKKIATTLDKLREESTKDQLDQHLQEANKFLNSIEKLYTNQCNAEVKLLEKYYALVDPEIDLLISEIDRFLEENANNENIQERRSSWTNMSKEVVDDPTEKLIPYQMKTCQFQVDAVNNWMFGLWETIRQYMLTCRSELTAKAEYYMQSTIVKLRKRLEVRLATHRPRYLRIKKTIYDVRLKELEDHLSDLHRVEESIQKYVGDSLSFNQISKQNGIAIISEYEKTMREIEERLKRATKSQHVASCIEQSKSAAAETVPKLQKNLEENFQLIEQNRKDIDRLICNFSESIKLFVEGGDYGREEARLFQKKIQKIKKGVPKKYKKCFDEYNAAKPDTLNKLKQAEKAILERLDLSKKEFLHNEKTCERIKNLQSNIRTCAYDMKFRLHRVDACIDYYEDMSKIKIWKRKNFDIMKEAVQDCMDKIQELTGALVKDGKRNGSGYLKQLNQLIDDAMTEIEKKAKGFYATHGPIINKGKIRGTCAAFMKEVKKNFDGFKVQVEAHCLQCVEDLIQHVLKLLRVNDQIYEGLVQRFTDGTEDNDNDEEDEMSIKLSQESLHLEEQKNALKDSDPAVTEILLKNKDRVRMLHFLIVKLINCVHEKVTVMEELIKSGWKDEDEEKEEENEKTVEINQ